MIYMNKRNFIKVFSVFMLFLFLSSCGQIASNDLNEVSNSEMTSIENKESTSSENSENISTSSSKKHTVTFKDYDGKILKTETIEDGKSATPPDNASKEGYKIVKWNKSFDVVKEDMVITPVYEKISGPTISIGNVTAKKGDTVKVPIKIQNNPGISGASVTIAFDSTLTLKKVKNGDALDDLNFTKPGELVNPCSFLWDGIDENIKENGEMLILTFKISDKAKSGEKLGVTVSYSDGAIYDKDLNNVDFDAVGGSITIE